MFYIFEILFVCLTVKWVILDDIYLVRYGITDNFRQNVLRVRTIHVNDVQIDFSIQLTGGEENRFHFSKSRRIKQHFVVSFSSTEPDRVT